MSIEWQNVAVVIIVLTAVGYLSRAVWQSVARRKAGCGGCGTCPAGANQEPSVVDINTLAATSANGEARAGSKPLEAKRRGS